MTSASDASLFVACREYLTMLEWISELEARGTLDPSLILDADTLRSLLSLRPAKTLAGLSRKAAAARSDYGVIDELVASVLDDCVKLGELPILGT